MKEKIEELLEKFRNIMVKKDANVRLVEINSNGIIKIELTGLNGLCPMLQLMLQFYLDKILKKKIPEITNIVYEISYNPENAGYLQKEEVYEGFEGFVSKS